MMPAGRLHPDGLHSAHWGVFSARWDGQRLSVTPSPFDPDPSPILDNFASAVRHRARITRPMVRRGWLERGAASRASRGADEFVAVSWDDAIARTADEIARIRETHGMGSVYGGSYGWASAGRFHHALSQVHRFLNCLGGYVRSVNTYSAGAANVILPHILGPYDQVGRADYSWDAIVAYADIVLAFGGMAIKNADVSSGGVSHHRVRGDMAAISQRGGRFVLVSPLRDDLPAEAGAEWLPVVPGTDVALMLGLAHEIVSNDAHDRAFLDRWCEGYPVFERYLLGLDDGQPKDARWAATISGVAEETIRTLAAALVGRRVLITVAQSLQRAEHGEQPVWMGATLAAILGQLGLPGGGFAYGLGSVGNAGKPSSLIRLPTLSQGRNPIQSYIPVARIADMLLQPGEPFAYNGHDLLYPDIRLVYWTGGNPFHHHQDINRLRAAFRRPDTVIVHESAWTATARHADIVLPATMTLERNDIGAGAGDPNIVAMRQVLPPVGEARNDHDIFAALAERFGVGAMFTEGRDEMGWIRHIYEETRTAIRAAGHDVPEFDLFWARGSTSVPLKPETGGMVGAFRRDPEGAPLPTPSGRIEIFSSTIAGFGYADCPGHAAWLPPLEGRDSEIFSRFPLHLIANQPATRLHSQLDFGRTSQASKIHGREPLRLHPVDAAPREIRTGDIVRVWNDRGALLAGAIVTEDVMPGVVQIATGAWYDPEDPAAERPDCVHGNPNMVTRDIGTSSLAQGCTGQLTLVDLARHSGDLPPIKAFDPPGGAR